MAHVRHLLPGLLVSAALAALAMLLSASDWLQSRGISALTVAIVLGIAVGNTLYPRIAVTTGAGVTFSKQTLLRTGVILYGLRLTLHDVGQVGIAGVLIDTRPTSTFAIAFVLGTRVFHLDRGTSILIGAGRAICGAAAVMATEPVVRAKANQVTIAISTVVVFGTVAMFLYPVIYALRQPRAWVSCRADAFWRLCGIDHPRGGTSFCRRPFGQRGRGGYGGHHKDGAGHDASALPNSPLRLGQPGSRTRAAGNIRARVTIPWFAIGFIGVVVFNSLCYRGAVARARPLRHLPARDGDAALGLTTHAPPSATPARNRWCWDNCCFMAHRRGRCDQLARGRMAELR